MYRKVPESRQSIFQIKLRNEKLYEFSTLRLNSKNLRISARDIVEQLFAVRTNNFYANWNAMFSDCNNYKLSRAVLRCA